MSSVIADISESIIQDLNLTSASWLLEFEGKTSSDLLWDTRLVSFLEQAMPDLPSSNYGRGVLLPMIFEFLSGHPANVLIEENRYVAVSANKRHFGRDKGLLWIDSKSDSPTFAFVMRTYHQPGEEKVVIFLNAIDHVPPQLLASAIRWLQSEKNQKFIEIVINDAVGKKKYLDPEILGISIRHMPLRSNKRRRAHR